MNFLVYAMIVIQIELRNKKRLCLCIVSKPNGIDKRQALFMQC